MITMYSSFPQDDDFDVTISHHRRVQQLVLDINLILDINPIIGYNAELVAADCLLKLLTTFADLPYDISNKIVDLLPIQYQLIKVYSNAITYDSSYSFIEFIAIIINNLLHYVLFILMLFYLNNLHLVYPILLLSFAITETIIICYKYRKEKFYIIGLNYFENAIGTKWRIQHQIINFFTKLDVIIAACIHLPITIILLSIKSNNDFMYLLIISVYYSSFIIIFTYKCYMNRRRIIFHEGLPEVTKINPAIYMPLIGMISLIFSIFYHESISLTVMSLALIFIGFMLHAISRPEFTPFVTRIMSLCEFISMYLQLIICILFGFQLYHYHNVHILSIFILLFSFIHILLLYGFLVYASMHDDGDDGNHPFHSREQQLYHFRHIVDIFVNVPIFIMIIYYLYQIHGNNDNLSLLWYLSISITTIYRLFGIIYFCGYDDHWIRGALQCFLMTTIQFTAVMIMSIVYLGTGIIDKSDIVLFVLSITFIVMGGLMCCCLTRFSREFLAFFVFAFEDDD